jgi:PAS domain S-box-containing protein
MRSPHRLRTQFAALVTLAAIVGAAALALLAWSALETRRLANAQQRAVTAAREVTGILALTQDYLLHREPRAREQWEARYRLLRQTAVMDLSMGSPALGMPFWIDELDALPLLFEGLRKLGDPAGETPFAARRRELLVDELLTAAQAVADTAYERERALTQRRNESELRLMVLALALPAALSLVFTAGGMVLSRRVLKPIARLQSCMERVAAGDLAARDANTARDELGELSRGFDRMASQLEYRDAALRASETFLRQVTDNLPAMVGYWDRELRNHFANAEYRRWFGKGPEDIHGRSIEALLGPDLFAKNKPYIDAALAGRRQDFQRAIPGPDGVVRHSQASYIPDVIDGQVQGFTVLVSDVTQHVEAEQALERALAEKETLLKEVYHRVKNNLQVVQSLMNLQARGLRDTATRDAFSEMAQRVRAMALAHEQLYQTENLSAVCLQDYVRDLLQQMATANAPAHGKVAVTAAVDPIDVGVDVAIPIGLLLTELVGNAFKHAFPQGQPGRIEVSVVREATGFRLSVADDGVGFAEPVGRGDTRSIGLQLAASLARQLGGELDFREGHGPGAHISLFIPSTKARTKGELS